MTTISLVDIHHFMQVENKRKNYFFLVMRTLRIYSLNSFHISHTTVLFYCFLGGSRRRQVTCGALALEPGIEPGPLQWELQVLTTGPPGTSLHCCLCLFRSRSYVCVVICLAVKAFNTLSYFLLLPLNGYLN